MEIGSSNDSVIECVMNPDHDIKRKHACPRFYLLRVSYVRCDSTCERDILSRKIIGPSIILSRISIDVIQFNDVSVDVIQFNDVSVDVIQFNDVSVDVIQFNDVSVDVIEFNDVSVDVIQFNDVSVDVMPIILSQFGISVDVIPTSSCSLFTLSIDAS
jgi:hypothetical protein